MINIFYEYDLNGPGKVVRNLSMGLKLIDVKFSSNDTKSKYPNLILQDHKSLYTNKVKNSIIGPNVCTLPIDNQVVMKQEYNKIIVPSDWVKKKYMRWIPENKIEVWPVGIDTDYFHDTSNEEKNVDCLIYFKRRDKSDLNLVINFLLTKSLTYAIVEYGSYDEKIFKETISNSKFGFVINKSESQGIAIQEMMSSNLPLLVWDIEYWSDRGDEYKVPSTSIPYWDETCGVSFKNIEDLENKFNFFMENLNNFKPREYILQNLTLRGQAKKILNLFGLL